MYCLLFSILHNISIKKNMTFYNKTQPHALEVKAQGNLNIFFLLQFFKEIFKNNITM